MLALLDQNLMELQVVHPLQFFRERFQIGEYFLLTLLINVLRVVALR
jgi:hypothetical protein